MRPSRGMGCINPAKQPRTITKRDGDAPVSLYKKGGTVKKFAGGGTVNPSVLAAQKAEADLRNYNDSLMFMDRSEIPPPEVQKTQKAQLYKKMIDAAKHGYKPTVMPGQNYGFETPKEWAGSIQSRKEGGAVGLYANIHAKQQRIAKGSGEKMRKPGAKGAPTADAFKQSAKTAKKA